MLLMQLVIYFFGYAAYKLVRVNIRINNNDIFWTACVKADNLKQGNAST